MPISLGKILENPGMTIPIYFITDRISNNELSVEYSPLTSTVGDFVYSVPGEVKITMIPYVKEIIEQFEQYDTSKLNANTPAAEHLFKVDDAATSLTQRQATIFHNFVAKCLFMTKRVRPDISTAVAFLEGPDQDNWKKLVRMIRLLFMYDSLCIAGVCWNMTPFYVTQSGASVTHFK
jgi:hypothetical protein